MKKCDDLFGLIVRARDLYRCQACGRQGREKDGVCQAAHGWSRGHHNTRYDFENAWCLCRGCHKKYTHRPADWCAWMLDRQGPTLYAEVQLRARMFVKLDYSAVYLYLKRSAEVYGVIA